MVTTTSTHGSAATGRSSCGRRACIAALLALLLTLPSCFTMTVWGFQVEDDTDIVTGEQETVMAYDSETEWSWKLFGLRVLLTPVTLALDCATAPVQAFFLWNDDDC